MCCKVSAKQLEWIVEACDTSTGVSKVWVPAAALDPRPEALCAWVRGKSHEAAGAQCWCKRLCVSAQRPALAVSSAHMCSVCMCSVGMRIFSLATC